MTFNSRVFWQCISVSTQCPATVLQHQCKFYTREKSPHNHAPQSAANPSHAHSVPGYDVAKNHHLSQSVTTTTVLKKRASLKLSTNQPAAKAQLRKKTESAAKPSVTTDRPTTSKDLPVNSKTPPTRKIVQSKTANQPGVTNVSQRRLNPSTTSTDSALTSSQPSYPSTTSATKVQPSPRTDSSPTAFQQNGILPNQSVLDRSNTTSTEANTPTEPWVVYQEIDCSRNHLKKKQTVLITSEGYMFDNKVSKSIAKIILKKENNFYTFTKFKDKL